MDACIRSVGHQTASKVDINGVLKRTTFCSPVAMKDCSAAPTALTAALQCSPQCSDSSCESVCNILHLPGTVGRGVSLFADANPFIICFTGVLSCHKCSGLDAACIHYEEISIFDYDLLLV